ncbi:integrase core domain-containing protein, partial [Hydrogenophaga sp.]|uniref:integrase core domain-containing protein n=1 Tax=Hydrogenophaga sp. TaxID=1904254 RepID=UPI0025C2AAAF
SIDNGTQSTDRFTSKNKQPTGKHVFDKQCQDLNIEHRLAPPRHPQTNGMVERFNGRISELVQQTRFASAAELDATLNNYMFTYNHHIPQRSLGHLSPVDALKSWREKKPELFIKRVYKQAELDTCLRSQHRSVQHQLVTGAATTGLRLFEDTEFQQFGDVAQRRVL